MDKTITHKNKIIKFVDVNDEPLHKEALKNEYIRLYVVTIPSGTKTLYHRHSVNTVYAVIQGGIVKTDIVGSSNRYPMEFPKSFHIFTKLRWGIRNLLVGSINMSKGFFFVLPHKSRPIVHRAEVSQKNKDDMIMLGVEIKGKINHHNIIELNRTFYRKDYESGDFFVYRLTLKPGQATGFNEYNFPGLIIAFNTGYINVKEGTSLPAENIILKCGSFHWHSGNVLQNIVNTSNENFEAIIIAMR